MISIIGASTWQAMLPSLIVNGLILIYCLLPGTKAAFVDRLSSQSSIRLSNGQTKNQSKIRE